MFEEVLPKGTVNTVAYLSFRLDPFYLAGGTGLALQLGYRSSEDLDFFSDRPFNTDTLVDRVRPEKVLYISHGTVHCEIKGIRVSFLHYTAPLLRQTVEWRNIRIAHTDDIAAEKIKTISQRGFKKDFIDLYAVLQVKYAIAEVCGLFKNRFEASDINFYHVLKSLTFFEDAEEDPMPVMAGVGRGWQWQTVKDYFVENIGLFEKEFGF